MSKIPRLKRDQIVEITWLDAETVAGWVSPQEAVRRPKSQFKTLGYFSGMDKKYLYLSWSIGIDGNTTRSKDSLPLGCIEKIRKL